MIWWGEGLRTKTVGGRYAERKGGMGGGGAVP